MIEQQTAHDARVIVETRIASLRARAVREVRVITDGCGLAYVQHADDLRWDDVTRTGQARIGGVWETITPLGLQDFAQAEHLQLIDSEAAADAEFIAGQRAQLIEQIDALDTQADDMALQIEQLQGQLDSIHAEIEALQDELGALGDDDDSGGL